MESIGILSKHGREDFVLPLMLLDLTRSVSEANSKRKGKKRKVLDSELEKEDKHVVRDHVWESADKDCAARFIKEAF